MLDGALTHIERTGQKAEHAEMLRLKGEALLTRDRSATGEADKCFREALEVARAQEAKWWELRTSVSLARLLRDTGRADEAHQLLAGIYTWFTEGFAARFEGCQNIAPGARRDTAIKSYPEGVEC